MKSRFLRPAILFVPLTLVLGGCALLEKDRTIQLPDEGWICGNMLFDNLQETEKPCTGTKDLALSGEALPPAGD